MYHSSELRRDGEGYSEIKKTKKRLMKVVMKDVISCCISKAFSH
jgi:ribosomal protein L10